MTCGHLYAPKLSIAVSVGINDQNVVSNSSESKNRKSKTMPKLQIISNEDKANFFRETLSLQIP